MEQTENMIIMNDADKYVVSEREFLQYILEVMQKSRKFQNVKTGEKISDHLQLDLSAEQNGEEGTHRLIIEVRQASLFTLDRIQPVLARFRQIHRADEDAGCVFLFPGKLTDRLNHIFEKYGIKVWDRDYFAAEFHEEIAQTPHPFFQSLFTVQAGSGQEKELDLIDRLNLCTLGKADWTNYQRLIGEIFTYLFCPPLSAPLTERMDVNNNYRREYIFPNYCNTGFWAFLRTAYTADYIVADAVNSSQNLSVKDVRQFADFLKVHGTGLFGMLITRRSVSDSACFTAREAWVMQKKMILILHDNDIEQMLLEKRSGRDPENVIRQKIEDFRLSFE